MMQKLIDSPESCVEDAIKGVLLADSRIVKVEGFNILVRSDYGNVKDTQVQLISGGGSGHEPAHSGFIGNNMLSCAVLGNVFASPSVNSIMAAIRIVSGSKGVLLIVKNYTGDRLNFGMAIEIAKQEGIHVMMCIVKDDCALPIGKGITGGRGIAGTVFVHKVAGALAASGASLEEVHRCAEAAATNIYTLGVALSTCTVPGTTTSTTNRLSKLGCIELGMGIHGEPGREQLQLPTQGAASYVAKLLVDGILGNTSTTTTNSVISGDISIEEKLPRLKFNINQKVAVLINNLGSLPVLELQIVTGAILTNLFDRGLIPVRVYSGPYMTSLEMCGLSLSIYVINDEQDLNHLDLSTTAPAWIASPIIDYTNGISSRFIEYNPHKFQKDVPKGLISDDGQVILSITRYICDEIISIEPQLTHYDTVCGDGDCGLVMKKGALQIIKDVLDTAIFHTKHIDLSIYFTALAEAVSGSMGGTSGILLELCFRAMANYFATSLKNTTTYASNISTNTMEHIVSVADDWINSLHAGISAIQYYGGATQGMRTMLDALIPAIEVLRNGGDINSASIAATNGMSDTKKMNGLAGRSNYVSQQLMEGIPDPGAVAMASIFIILAKHIK